MRNSTSTMRYPSWIVFLSSNHKFGSSQETARLIADFVTRRTGEGHISSIYATTLPCHFEIDASEQAANALALAPWVTRVKTPTEAMIRVDIHLDRTDLPYVRTWRKNAITVAEEFLIKNDIQYMRVLKNGIITGKMSHRARRIIQRFVGVIAVEDV